MLALLALALLATPAAADPLPIIPCQVERVIDGDSLAVRECTPWPGLTTEARVRVLDIDTPERSHRAACERERRLAEQATTLAVELLHGTVLLHIEGRDSFGRVLAHITLPDGRDYGELMVGRGLAMPYAERERGWCG